MRPPTCSRPTASAYASCRCPAWTASPRRTQAYRDAVLPPAVPARVAVEAASAVGWDRWVGDDGDIVGDGGLRRLRPPAGALRALRLHAGERRRARQRPCWAKAKAG